MKKILYNRTLFIIATILEIAELILSTLEYIDLGLFIIPIILLYVVWLFILAKSAQNE